LQLSACDLFGRQGCERLQGTQETTPVFGGKARQQAFFLTPQARRRIPAKRLRFPVVV
jgi:hypothetical protein